MKKYDLHQEFSELENKIQSLILTDEYFNKLFLEHAHLNQLINRIESGEEFSSDEVLEHYRQTRNLLNEKLFSMLT